MEEPMEEALIGKGDLRALARQHLGDAPGDGVVVGHSHDQALLAGHQSRFGFSHDLLWWCLLFHSGTSLLVTLKDQ
jgi:hypothetical protein